MSDRTRLQKVKETLALSLSLHFFSSHDFRDISKSTCWGPVRFALIRRETRERKGHIVCRDRRWHLRLSLSEPRYVLACPLNPPRLCLTITDGALLSVSWETAASQPVYIPSSLLCPLPYPLSIPLSLPGSSSLPSPFSLLTSHAQRVQVMNYLWALARQTQQGGSELAQISTTCCYADSLCRLLIVSAHFVSKRCIKVVPW